MSLAQLTPIERTALLVLAVLVVATLAVALLRRARPERDFRELSARTRSWWVMAALFFLALALSPRLSFVFFGLMSFWAMKEYVTLLATRPADHGALVLAFLAVPVQYLWVDRGWYGMFLIFVPVYVFLALPVRLVLAQETRGFVASASQLQWGLMAFVFGFSHLAYQTRFGPVGGADGRTLLVFLVFVAETSDVLQYVWGKLLGRHKVMPGVSPNKTWEGLIGGVLSTALASLGLRFLTPFSTWETLLVALGIGLAGFFGGAVMSAVKRDFGVKDFGRLIPGHGGVLDRIDSLCFAGPLFFHYLAYFHY